MSSIAGNSFSITVSAYDAGNSVVTGYAGTIHVVAADNQASVPPDYAFQTADHGVHTFTNGVTLRTAGTDPITVSDVNQTNVTGSTTVTVSPAAARSFQVFGSASTTAGEASSADMVTLDQYGNTVTTYAGTVHFTSSDGAATVPADYTFTGNENGSHFFHNAIILRTLGNQRVTVTDRTNGSLTGHTSVVVYSTCPQAPIRTVLAAQFSGRPPIGLSDEVALVTDSGVCVMAPANGSFATPEFWTAVPFYGTRATLAVDINGDGLVDLVAVDDSSTWVMLSNGHGFSAPSEWSNRPFFGSRATLAADVTGSGRAALVAVDDTSTWVMTSSGAGFSAPAQWSNRPFHGSRGTFISNVTMTGHAALIAVDDSMVWVMTSTGTAFTNPSVWSSRAFYGSLQTLATSEGSPELIAINGGGQWIMTSTGAAFSAPILASSVPFHGTRATLPALLQGGTSVPDLLAVNDSSIWVATSRGAAFQSPAQWASSVP